MRLHGFPQGGNVRGRAEFQVRAVLTGEDVLLRLGADHERYIHEMH